MTELEFGEAIDTAVAVAMAGDERIVVFGEDVPMLRRGLLLRFGPNRVRATPISESAFLGAAVGAAMAGARPLVEIMLVDFLGVAMSALLNEAAMIGTLSGGRVKVPMVVRATCGGGYGDAGQHEQSLWGMLGGIPGLAVVVPSTPADGAGLMLAALAHDGPVVFLEHKLLSQQWLRLMGGAGRPTVTFDVPAAGARGAVPAPLRPVPIGEAATRREGRDLTILSLAVGVHRSLEASERLAAQGIDAGVIDLRSASPLDRGAILEAARRTGRILVVDEDYLAFGLSGEIAAVIAESGTTVRFGRIGSESVIPYARHLESRVLPSAERITEAARRLMGE